MFSPRKHSVEISSPCSPTPAGSATARCRRSPASSTSPKRRSCCRRRTRGIHGACASSRPRPSCPSPGTLPSARPRSSRSSAPLILLQGRSCWRRESVRWRWSWSSAAARLLRGWSWKRKSTARRAFPHAPRPRRRCRCPRLRCATRGSAASACRSVSSSLPSARRWIALRSIARRGRSISRARGRPVCISYPASSLRRAASMRADVFRPDDGGRHPAMLTYGPYGKGLAFQEGYKTAWEIMARENPDALAGSSNRYQNWEVVDPEKWVPEGYAIVRVDSRGAGRSPGTLCHNNARETRDLHLCIEWAAAQKWCSGKVGMNGISYYASNQWRAAATRPPHLAAICAWEGWNDAYRDGNRHGGIICTFRKHWQDMQVKTVQHGQGERGARNRVTGELVCGPETLSEDELLRNREDMWGELLSREMDGPYYRERSADLAKVAVPLLSAANWGGQGLHTRGNFEGFVRSSSRQKWLAVHGGSHWAPFYTDYGRKLQLDFFDHFLKGKI